MPNKGNLNLNLPDLLLAIAILTDALSYILLR